MFSTSSSKLNLDQASSKLIKQVQTWSKNVQTCLENVQTFSKYIQTCSKYVRKMFKICWKDVQTCSNMFKLDQARSDMFQTTVDVVWCFLANRRRCASRSKMKQILLKISWLRPCAVTTLPVTFRCVGDGFCIQPPTRNSLRRRRRSYNFQRIFWIKVFHLLYN